MRTDRDVDSFDRRAASYERDWRAEFHRLVVAGAAEVALATLAHPADVLDVGCGTGALLRTLAERLPEARTMAGVDPAPSMVERAAAGLSADPRARLTVAAAEALPFDRAGFDLVVSTVSFDHWADQPAGLAEVARVLRPTGRFVLVDLFATGLLRPLAALGRRRARMRTRPELEALFTAAGLHPEDWHRVYSLGPLPLVQAVTAAPAGAAATR